MNQAYIDGQIAYRNNLPRKNNPYIYELDKDNHKKWNQGWDDMKDACTSEDGDVDEYLVGLD